MKRPFINLLAKELIAEFERSKADPERLQLVREEMKRRKKAARLLQPYIAKIDLLLAQINAGISIDNSLMNVDTELVKDISVGVSHSQEEGEEQAIPPPSSTAQARKINQQRIVVIKTERHCLKPEFLARLFGASRLEIIISESGVTFNTKGYSVDIEYSAIQNIVPKSGFLFSDLSIESNGTTIVLPMLSKSQAQTLQPWLTLMAQMPRVLNALSDFNSLFQRSTYLNRGALEAWKSGLGNIPEVIDKYKHLLSRWDSNSRALFELIQTAEEKVLQYNNDFIRREAKNWHTFFSNLESKPLTSSQVEAILRDEDATLVAAGAGTGKTSTVVGKVGYLLSKGVCKPEEVLALAFGRDAASEMRQRVKQKTGFDVEIRTFHSLGLYILKEQAGFRLKISDVAVHEHALLALLAKILKEMAENDHTRSLIQNLISYHRYPAKYLEDFDSQANYFKYLRKYDPITLRGERVKSFEELLIADWLTLNGIQYSYEHPYEHQTATRSRNQYRPDFYLVDYGIYLEHFGINRNGKTAPFIDSKAYNESIQWKRALHAKHQTKMIETYSWERQEGVILDLLKDKLEANGIKVQQAGKEFVSELLQIRAINKKLVSLIKDFLAVFKEGQWTIDEVRQQLDALSPADRVRANVFMALFEEVYQRYDDYLKSRQELDFSDLIRESTCALAEGKAKLKFTRVIVDEYQDISRGRYRFLKAILEQEPDCRIMCVGDDWQAIYGFTGSDVTMMTNFESLFGFSARVDLNQTFRFTAPILEASARFIQKNPIQLRKQILARAATLPKSIEILVQTPTNSSLSLKDILATVDAVRPASHQWKVLVLGRYGFLKTDDFEAICESFENLSVEYMTIHKSKGLEADAVVILGLTDEKYGFPGTIETDPLMNLIIPGEDAFENSEERRVLYVAMTRAKEYLLLCTNSTSLSCFIEELSESEQYPEIHALSADTAQIALLSCPACSGKLYLKYPNKKLGYAWVCNLEPYCTYKAKTCQTCKQFPMLASGVCANPNCSN